MSYLAVKENTPLMETEPTNIRVKEKTPFHEIAPYKGGEQAKASFIVVKVTHFPESIDQMAKVMKENGVKTLVLENSPASLIDVVQGKKTAQEHVREYVLKETNGAVDLERNPGVLLLPRLDSYKHRAEILEKLGKEIPGLEVVILDPYYDKEAVGLRGETYDDRMKLQRSITENIEDRRKYAIANKDFEGAVVHIQYGAKELARQLAMTDGLRAAAIAKEIRSDKVAVEEGEEHDVQKHLKERMKENPVSVTFANRSIIDKVFKESENFRHPLLELAQQYITKGETIDKNTADLLAARACAAMVMFEREMQRLLTEGRKLTAEKDYQIIKAANELSFDDCKKICIA